MGPKKKKNDIPCQRLTLVRKLKSKMGLRGRSRRETHGEGDRWALIN